MKTMIRTRGALLLLALLVLLFSPAYPSPSTSSASCPFSNAADQAANHHDHTDHAHDHGHSHAHDHDCSHGHHVGHTHSHHDHDLTPADNVLTSKHKLAEELAEEEELRLYGFKSDLHMDKPQHHHHEQQHADGSLGLWMRALGCSLLVSMASLICLIILPLIVAHGKPSRTVVDFLAAFGAGAMLGDAFLHQLPHALGGSHAHSHSHGPDHNHGHSHGHHEGVGHSHDGDHGHAHSIEDLSVGLAVLAGIILFFIVEKIVRHVEKASSKGSLPWSHHHHHQHRSHHDENESIKQHPSEADEKKDGEEPSVDDARIEDTSGTSANGSPEHERSSTDKPYRRKKTAGGQEESEASELLPDKDESDKKSSVVVVEQAVAPNLVLGYLNLFSDGVHNFTDGMALGAAFLNHGALGGWSRTLFLLAHELPQEVGDFGILVHSGFSVLKALAFNFLSALVALAGTAVALVLGGNPGHSSLIEGFTAGGFIYIAVAGVLPEMHQHGTSPKTTFIQLIALSLGMTVALTISLVE
ncbi:hypothetical protein GOP47_0028303 [Adiantum capillus-veneris]|nr:hypothetical protein GOP47_0028303 [Adiantum capillus-veneris]